MFRKATRRGMASRVRTLLIASAAVTMISGLAVAVTTAGATAPYTPGHWRGVITAGNSLGNGLQQRLHGVTGRAGTGNLQYWGGPVMHSDANYAIFWEPSGHTTAAAYKSVITGYFGNVAAASGAASNDYSVATQYYDSSGNISYTSSFPHAAIVDTTPYPASGCASTSGQPCLTDAQMETEVNNVIAANGLPSGLGAIYYVFTPSGVATCFDSTSSDCSSGGRNFDYCAYHSSYGSGSSSTLYAVMPYAYVSGCNSGQSPNNNAADSTLNVTSHENIEAITDPLGTAWYDSSGNEIGDKCAWNFGSTLGSTAYGAYNEQISSGDYYLQQEWSNATSTCVQRMGSGSGGGGGGSTPVAAFTWSPTNPVHRQAVYFNSSTSTDTGGTITRWSWNFGDGKTSTAQNPSHTYRYAGGYTVSLKITDSTGKTSTVSHLLTVS